MEADSRSTWYGADRTTGQLSEVARRKDSMLRASIRSSVLRRHLEQDGSYSTIHSATHSPLGVGRLASATTLPYPPASGTFLQHHCAL